MGLVLAPAAFDRVGPRAWVGEVAAGPVVKQKPQFGKTRPRSFTTSLVLRPILWRQGWPQRLSRRGFRLAPPELSLQWQDCTRIAYPCMKHVDLDQELSPNFGDGLKDQAAAWA
jgi:hypothetical protein